MSAPAAKRHYQGARRQPMSAPAAKWHYQGARREP
jgi:hypothetical protein